MVRQLIKVCGLVQVGLLLSLFATSSYAQAPWSQYDYTSKNVKIYHQQRGQRFDVSQYLSVPAGEYLEAIKLVVSSRYNHGQLALIKNGELVASNTNLSPKIKHVNLPYNNVIRRGDKFEIVTTEEVYISNVGATFEVVGRAANNIGSLKPQIQPVPGKFDINLVRNCKWSEFQPKFVAGIGKPITQVRKLTSGTDCNPTQTRGIPNCYKYTIVNNGGVTGVRFTGASSDKNQNFIRSDQNPSGNVCLSKGKSTVTIMKLDNSNMQSRVILKPARADKTKFDKTFVAGDVGDQFLSRWYRKNFEINN